MSGIQSGVLLAAADLVDGLDLAGGVTVYPMDQITVCCLSLEEVVGLADRIGAQVTSHDPEQYPGNTHHSADGTWRGIHVRATWIEDRTAVTA